MTQRVHPAVITRVTQMDTRTVVFRQLGQDYSRSITAALCFPTHCWIELIRNHWSLMPVWDAYDIITYSTPGADAFASPGAIPWPYGSPLGNLNFDVMLLVRTGSGGQTEGAAGTLVEHGVELA